MRAMEKRSNPKGAATARKHRTTSRDRRSRKAHTIDAKRLNTEAHLQMRFEDWRMKKRGEWRHVMNALDLFQFGSAYTPVGNDLYELQKAANRIARSMDVDWVSW